VNENFAVGFTCSSKPTAELLLATMGMPANVFICFDDVVLPGNTPLVPDGSYNVVELPSDDFRRITVALPAPSTETVALDAFVECTVSSLIRSVEQRVPDLFHGVDPSSTSAVLLDNTGCILDFSLPIFKIPHDSSTVNLAFV